MPEATSSSTYVDRVEVNDGEIRADDPDWKKSILMQLDYRKKRNRGLRELMSSYEKM